MRARYDTQTGSPSNTNEAFFNEANTIFSGAGSSTNLYGFRGDDSVGPSTWFVDTIRRMNNPNSVG